MMKNLVSKVLKQSNASIADDEENSGVVHNWIDSGCYIFNALLSGDIYKGFAGNKVTAICGEKASGKSWYCLQAVKAFLDKDPEAVVFYYDSESTLSKQMLVDRGIDPTRVIIIEVTTIEEFRTSAKQLLDEYEGTPEKERTPIMLVLDSLGMLSSSKEIEDIASGADKRDMTKAQLVKGTMRALTVQLGRLDIPMFVTAHVYKEIGSMFPQDIPAGGEGLQYSASTIIMLGKAQEKDGNEVVGSIIRCKTYKSRFTKEKMSVRTLLRYDTGLNRYYGLLDLAEAAGIFKKVSTRYEINGKMVFGKTINENPEEYFTKDILDRINEYVQQTFLYGVSNKDFNLDAVLKEPELLNEEENV